MIPFYRPFVGHEEEAAACRVLRSGWLTSGPEVEAFEEEAAIMLAAPEDAKCAAVSSCTAGLYLLLKAIGIGPGWDVIVPNLTFAATANAVIAVGAELVIVDVNANGLIDLAGIEPSARDQKTAIIGVTYAGQDLTLTSEDHDLIYDQAHSFQPGAYKLNSAWSFFPTKNITTGEGGLIACSKYLYYNRVRPLRDHGRAATDDVMLAGALNFRMTDLQAAIGREQIKKLPMMLAAKRRIEGAYRNGLAGKVQLPPLGTTHLFPVRHPERDRIKRYLAERGIQTSVHWKPLSKMRAFADLVGEREFPVSERIGERTLSLPFYPGMTEAEVESVIKLIQEAT